MMTSLDPITQSQSYELENDHSDSADPVKAEATNPIMMEPEGFRSRNQKNQKKKHFNFISSISKDEPVVTRRELWSYYSSYLDSSTYLV